MNVIGCDMLAFPICRFLTVTAMWKCLSLLSPNPNDVALIHHLFPLCLFTQTRWVVTKSIPNAFRALDRDQMVAHFETVYFIQLLACAACKVDIKKKSKLKKRGSESARVGKFVREWLLNCEGNVINTCVSCSGVSQREWLTGNINLKSAFKLRI